jgi:hypothetical protein
MTARPAIALTLLFVIAFAFACRRRIQSISPQTKVASIQTDYESEQIAAVSAVAREMYVEDWRLLVIENAVPCPTPLPKETPNPKVLEMRQQMEDDAFHDMPELARETIGDFHKRENECHPLPNKLDIPVRYVLVGHKDLDSLFPLGEFDREWRRFYSKYSGSSGVINFSNPGFNRDYTQAVLSTGRGCGGLCGAGYFVLLTKDGGAWKIKTKSETWVS